MSNEIFYLYNTEISDNPDYKDCLYLHTLDSNISEWHLVPYCIRQNIQDINNEVETCYGDIEYTFEELRLKNIDSYNLYNWHAPIDMINKYEKYLTHHDLFLGNQRFCNCSGKWFGSQCQYSLAYSERRTAFHATIINYFGQKDTLAYKYQIVNDSSMLTCYEGLQCNSVICLDWREICNGIFNCENGEDEPNECLLLEINECKNDEYRCRFGMCIPKTFLHDFSYDCMDLSDEKPKYFVTQGVDYYCYKSTKLQCDFRLCDTEQFSCGDGQCQFGIYSNRYCNNGRDLFFRRTLFRYNFSNQDNGAHDISFDCWFVMLCISGNINTNLLGFNYHTCSCSEHQKSSHECRKSFEDYCPSSFMFQTEDNLFYPFIKFLYHNTLSVSYGWYLPTHICYNSTLCPSLPFIGLPLIDNMLCIAKIQHSKLIINPWTLWRIFSACTITHTSMLINDERLFYCNKSMKFISIHKIYDRKSDCYYGEDEEYMHRDTMMRLVNVTDRFKCTTTNQLALRQSMGEGWCSDSSDRWYIGECTTATDIACQFFRGVYLSPVNYVFHENCNLYSKILISNDDETDETNCEEWPKYRRCDGFWDLSNGEDELNCSNTIVSYITRTVLKCRDDEHYCVHRNGTIGCLSKKYAGDFNFNCLGSTDERLTATRACAQIDSRHLFQCLLDECISLSSLCDHEFDCINGDDELICPWSYNMTYPYVLKMFICKNGTAISYARRCDEIIDCQPDAEDEWLCDLGYKKSINSFDFIEEYPLLTIGSSHLSLDNTPYRTASLSEDYLWDISDDISDNWYCNRGIVVTTRSSNIRCLCPPSYYGARCEYQSERLLITVRIDIPASLSGHENLQNTIRLIACLMLYDEFIHHEQILHVSFMKQMFYLNYPRPPPKKRGNWSVRFDAALVETTNVAFIAAWRFDVPFSFLPFNRLVLHLMLTRQESCDTLPCIHGSCKRYLNSPHHAYCHCEQNWMGSYCNISILCLCAGGGKCLDQFRKSICICPLGRMGHDCHMLFNPCKDIKCEHGGTCVPSDERLTRQFTCVCSNGYYGSRCELANAYIDIYFNKYLSSHPHLLLVTAFVHFLETRKDSPGVLFVQDRVLHKQIPLNKPVRVYNNNQQFLTSFVLLQIFFKPDYFGYYIAAILKHRITNISTTIYQTNRCPYVNEVLHNRTIREFPLARKVKYYLRVCEDDKAVRCFHDEAYLCFCDKHHLPQCLFFHREPIECMTDYCHNNGRCVQNNINGMWDFGCICGGCAYGSLCQLTTSQYALSLDAMLGQDILANIPLGDQPLLIKVMLTILILMLSFGFISNILSVIIFKQPKVQEVGCGLYLFCLPIVGQLGLLILIGRFFYLLQTQLYNVQNRSVTLWSCIALEYFLSVCPMLFDWLTACVAVERSVYMIKGISFKKKDSVWWAKRVILLLTIAVLMSTWYEPFIRQLIDDPRVTTRHTWCIISFSWSWIKYYRLIINLINLIIPSLINLVATVYLLHKSTKMKQTFGKNNHEKAYFTVLKKQLPMYGSPFALVILSLMRLIFSFTLVCIIYQWQKYLYLTAYFISFVPLMGTFPIFVWPAEIYKTEFKKFFERIQRKLERRRI